MSAAVEYQSQREAMLRAMTQSIPYVDFLGITFDRRGDELTGCLHYSPELIGNPILPALHGGATGAFLEITGIFQLAWDAALAELNAGGERADAVLAGKFPPHPKPVDITFNYLRSGKPRDTYARTRVLRKGRRVANVMIEAWQDERSKLIATASGNFLLTPAP